MDDCGQLTIRCSQDYFSLDCGITAYELSDYSPGDEPGGRGTELKTQEPSQHVEDPPSLNQEPEEDNDPSGLSHHKLHNTNALFSDGGAEDSAGGPAEVAAVSGLQLQAEMSRSTPSLLGAPDRTRFWLELDSVYPDNMSQSCENLQVSPSNLCAVVGREAMTSSRCEHIWTVVSHHRPTFSSGPEQEEPSDKPVQTHRRLTEVTA